MHNTITSKKFVKSQPEKVKKKVMDMEPSELVINNILNFSKALSVRKSTLVDSVEVVLN